MSQNSSDTIPAAVAPTPPQIPLIKRIASIIGLPTWVFLGFILAQALVLAAISALAAVGISFAAVNDSVLNSVLGGVMYALSLAIVIGVPWLIKKRRTTKAELGMQRPPSWMDIVWVPTGAVIYIIFTSLLTAAAVIFLPFIDYDQAQDTGFTGISQQYEYILAFITLVVMAPVAEELLFRGYLLGKLRKYAPLWISILITSLLFAIVHFAWNVGLDVFALSIVLCLLRVLSGSIWPSIMLHMLKNGVAFYFLFINPTILSTL